MPVLQVQQQGSAVEVNFTATAISAQTAATRPSSEALSDALPRIHYGDLILPGRLATVVMSGDTDVAAVTSANGMAVANADSVVYTGKVEQAQVPMPKSPDGQTWPDLRRAPITTLPSSPVSVLSRGILRGVRLAVLAITPVYSQAGQTRFATRFNATLQGARLVDDATTLLSAFDPISTPNTGAGVQLPASTSVTCSDNAYQPVNPLLKSGSAKLWRIRVSHAGLQQLSAAALSAAGVTDPLSSLHITYRGQTIPIRRFGTTAIRFYGADPGDRWNAYDTYWLSVDGSPSPDMNTRSAPSGGTASTIALQRGKYTNNKVYDATMPGADGDHWFAADLKAANGTAATWPFTLTGMVLPAAGPAVAQVAFAGKTNSNHTLMLTTASGSVQTVITGIGTFTATFNLSGDFNGPSSFSVQSQANNAPEDVLPDYVLWERTVSLIFSGSGARFNIVAGAGTYQASSIPSAQGSDALYDVTNPVAPEVVLMDSGGNFSHPGGDHTYVMAGASTLWTSSATGEPALSKYTPFANDSAFNLQLVYITPAAFASAADTLVKFRQQEGYTAGYFDVQVIYDWWSFGQVSPDAIRNFLRYAYCTWSTKPLSVVMLGDGSVDPFDYLGYNVGVTGVTNITIIPPYMAPVDPYLTTSLGSAETACEACYAQLDGIDPLSDKIADLYYGRLPAKTASEATALVSKIIAYETAPFQGPAHNGSWRSRVGYITDNFYNSDGSKDGAGNFLQFAENSAAGLPRSIQPVKMYYDPYDPAPPASVAGARETDAKRAYDRTVAMFSSGLGIINYFGHANYADVAATDADPYHLFTFLDADGMTNAGKLPIVLEFTCLTSAFQTPIQYYGTSVDERLILVKNGAIAVWGSTSLGVTYSHEALAKGFYTTLWAAPPFSTPVGKAAAGGYVELFTQVQGVPQVDNLLYTFMVMGDPMTIMRVGGYTLNLPITAH